MASVERIHWIQPRGEKKKKKQTREGFLKTTHKEAESDAQAVNQTQTSGRKNRPVAQAEILIINFGNAANVQTENAPSRTLQNYQQLYLVRNRSRLKSNGPQGRRQRGN